MCVRAFLTVLPWNGMELLIAESKIIGFMLPVINTYDFFLIVKRIQSQTSEYM